MPKGRPKLPDPNANYSPKKIGGLTDTAFSIAKINDSFVFVKIQYNPISGDVGVPEMTIKSSLMEVEYELRDQIDFYLDKKQYT